ncbi:uncharacterized protein LOC129574129 isoform X2 [Sitodiplosis mosellana]|uniref:uncharacterized protein LOC129574129 isoform X2 n=1 Tax=Sitodiplosis mosellana TaxID=263140 RepID=UPI002444844F|nr:uncharacterized protein LOC129574129 isoform X2 [Sitodiplosis mosellana]
MFELRPHFFGEQNIKSEQSFCLRALEYDRFIFASARGNNGDDEKASVENDSDEYHTAISTVITTDSDVVATSNKLLVDANKSDSKAKGYRQLNQMHVEQQHQQQRRKATTDFVHKTNDTFDSGNRLTEKNRQLRKSFDNSKQTSQQHEHLNVLDTKNRCDTICKANGSNSTQQQQQHHRRLGNATAWSKSHEQITHKFSRRSTRNSLENKAPLSSCCNQKANEDHQHNINSKRGLCKRFAITDYSDSSDVNSETNLVIENMRNRECEMYRKISFNNGYFDMTDSSSSGSYMHCRSNANSIETTSTSHHGKNKKCLCKTNDWSKKSPKFPAKRKCRSFPLTENRQIEPNRQIERNANCENVIQNETKSRLNCACTNNAVQTRTSETETNTYQTNSRKITITIRTKTVPDQKTTKQQQQPPQVIDNYLTNTCESSEESDTTVSDYATLCSESDANAKQTLDGDNQNDFDVESINESETNSSSSSSDDDDNSFFSIKSDIEYQSETSQYFNCTSFTDTENMHFSTEKIQVPSEEDDHLSEENVDIETSKRNQSELNDIQTTNAVKHTHSNKSRKESKMVAVKKSLVPMICIEQELCENRIVTSKIEVDKEKIKEFKRRQKKRTQPKIIIDSTFSEEIFNETLNRSAQICCDKNVIDNIVSSLEAEKCEPNYYNQPTKSQKNAQNIRNKFISDDFVFDKLQQASPKYTGKSIRRLLAHRIEQQSITSVRRTLLQNVAYAITEKEKMHKREMKKMTELAPIKPPRSFTASSSSSPLSKQSFESSATIPISELNRPDPTVMGFVMPCNNNAQKYDAPHVSEETSVQFGWVRPGSIGDNNEPPTSHYITADQFSSSTQDTQANSMQNMGFCMPKEDIDTVDSSNRSTKDFERFSAVLTESRQNNLSTPIKDFCSSGNNAKFRGTEAPPVTDVRVSNQTSKPADTFCKNCHCKVKKEKPQHMFLGKTGKRIGKAALKRTKTFIGTSKRLLTKPSIKESPAKKEKKTDETNEEIFSTPLKDGDHTVCNNRDTISQEKCQKRVHKSLNLTPKELNQNIVELNPSPKRTAAVSNSRLLTDAAKPTDDSEQYATPDEVFDFDRVVNLPPEQEKIAKRSPSKMILKLAKSSKKLFQMKGRDKEKQRRSSTDESTHYYKANDYDEIDNKVLIMGEMLSEMRKRIENGQGSSSNIDEDTHERPPSAKKCLFSRDRTISTSSGDLLEQDSLVEQIATIDLHDEPEPLYAEIETTRSTKVQETMYHSCREDEVNAIKSCPSEAVQLKEVYINDRANSKPNKYIMVNNNPKILYATVNRGSMQTRSLETIESRTEQSEDQVDGETDDKKSFLLSSSYESLDMSLINDFATVVQSELDECQFKMNEMFTTATTNDPDQTSYDEVDALKHDRKSNSGSESIATSDMNSGCSSFYRKSQQIVSNRPRKTLSDFVDTLSFDTVGTGSYCESLSRGNDLNSEIKDTITSLEYMPSEMGDSTDLSNDFATNIAFRSCLTDNNSSKGSAKFVSFNRPNCNSLGSSPSSSRTFSKIESPSKTLRKMSPSLKAIKTKFRNSFRLDRKSASKNDSYATDGIGSDEMSEVKSCASTSSSGSSADLQRKKLFESICSRFETMPNESMANGAKMNSLIERIRQQQEMRKSILNALEVCRTNSEFHNSRELVEAEQLMLMSSLKECSALEKLIEMWQSDGETVERVNDLGEGVLTIKYMEFELKVDTIFDTHFNYFYLCVCSYRDQVEFTDSRERTDNRIVFNNLKMQFHNLTADFEIRVEIYALRLRKNVPTEKSSEPFIPKCDSSRFRLQGKTLLTSTNLSRKHVSSSYHSPRKLQRNSNGKYVYTSYGLISPAIVLCGQGNTLCDSLKIGYQEQLYFLDSKANGFLNIADSKQKWDRLWCRIDGFSMNFWNYPQDVNDTQSPILTLNLDQCNYRTKSLLVDREICPRPRTFKIDVVHAVDPEKRDRNRCIQSYFISAENQLDLELWLSEIQKIFEMIKSWNI